MHIYSRVKNITLYTLGSSCVLCIFMNNNNSYMYITDKCHEFKLMRYLLLMLHFTFFLAVIDSQDLDPAEPVPEKCNSYNISGNGTILYKQSFLCTSSDNPYCCGEEGHQYCCSSRLTFF